MILFHRNNNHIPRLAPISLILRRIFRIPCMPLYAQRPEEAGSGVQGIQHSGRYIRYAIRALRRRPTQIGTSGYLSMPFNTCLYPISLSIVVYRRLSSSIFLSI